MPFALFAGLAAGLVHVLSGPDHLVAVAPLAADEDRPHWRAGFQWGLGHTTGVLIVGALLFAFREVLPIDAISAYSERIVGVALIAVGVWGAYRATRLQVHRHDAAHGAVHAHVKGPGGRAPVTIEHDAQHRHPHLHGHAQTHASFAMGMVHGLAGSSHLFGVLPALALSTRMDAVAYLGGFGVGAIVAMTAFAALVGVIAQGIGRRDLIAHRGVLYACSLSAVIVGGFWLVA
jgi:hypothetical protein